LQNGEQIHFLEFLSNIIMNLMFIHRQSIYHDYLCHQIFDFSSCFGFVILFCEQPINQIDNLASTYVACIFLSQLML
jgi:hypothetical protein